MKRMLFVATECGLISLGTGQTLTVSPELSTLVKNERNFAETCGKEGIRSSFVKFFADSGLGFAPEPYVFKQWASKNPPSTTPFSRTLYWEPIAGDIANSGDLGFTTGPYVLTDNTKQDKPRQYGFFFSIWRKQPAGDWKLIIDCGTSASNEVEKSFGQQFRPSGHGALTSLVERRNDVSPRTELLLLDRNFSEDVHVRSAKETYAKILDPNARLMREGMVPVVGREAVLEYVRKENHEYVLIPYNGGVSDAGDLGYTYGEYRTEMNSEKPSGYYARLWGKNVQGSWRLMVEAFKSADKAD